MPLGSKKEEMYKMKIVKATKMFSIEKESHGLKEGKNLNVFL